MQVVDVKENDDETEFTGTIPSIGESDTAKSNVIRFQENFGDLPVKEFEINGVLYTETSPEVKIYDDGWYITVPGAAKYTIRGDGDENAVVLRTIIWTNPDFVPRDEEQERWTEEFSLDHGYAYITAVYDENNKLVDSNEYKSENWVVNENGGGVGADGFGWISLYPGYKAVFEFVPEYGYQLTDIRINGQKLGLSGLMNQFEFIMPDANIHFDAEFTKTEDIVKTDSESIESGTIKLATDSIDRGTAQLTVSDIKLSDNKVAEFENAAGDYTISNYLDIDLYQVFYKGKNDADDVWSNKIEELKNDATITIKLADGITADDIVIVHNIHDGDKYEIIEIESYDAETNTITFKTSSFSNYAIATKTKQEEGEKIKLVDDDSKIKVEFLSKNHTTDDYMLNVTNMTNLTEKDLEAYGLTKEEFDQALNMIKESTKKHGTFIALYDIDVTVPNEDGRKEEN